MNILANKRILLPRFDTLGDIVLLQGFLCRLQERVPDAVISLLVRDGYDQLATLFPPSIQWLTTCLQPYGDKFTHADQAELARLLDLIGREKFDTLLISTFDRTWTDDLIAAFLSEGVRRVSFAGPVCHSAPWAEELHASLGLATDNLYDSMVAVQETSREIEKYQAMANYLFNAEDELPLPQLAVSAATQAKILPILAGLGIQTGGYFVCVTTCTTTLPIKSWPIERFVKIITWVEAELGLKPLLLGHESEKEKISAVVERARAVGVNPAVMLGRTGDLEIIAGLLQQARFYVGNDTGPMHIAAAVGVPTVGLFGGGHWPRFLPVGELAIGIAGELPCFGCDWGCIFGDAPCVRLVTVEDVQRAIRLILGKQSPPGNYLPVMDGCRARLEELFNRYFVANLGALTKLERENEVLSKKVEAMRQSISWRLTKLLRWLADRLFKP